MSSSPAIILSVVDLPQPDGPSRTTNSLSRISSARLSTATTSSASRLVSDLNSMRAMAGPLALDRAGGQAGNDGALEHQRENNRRNDGEHAGRIDEGKADREVRGERRHDDRQRLRGGCLREHQREQKLVPTREEREQDHGDQRRLRQRQVDAG